MALSAFQAKLKEILERIAAGRYLTAAEVQATDPAVMNAVNATLQKGADGIRSAIGYLRVLEGEAVEAPFGGAVTSAPPPTPPVVTPPPVAPVAPTPPVVPYVSPATSAALGVTPGFDAFFKAADAPTATPASTITAFNAATLGPKAPVPVLSPPPPAAPPAALPPVGVSGFVGQPVAAPSAPPVKEMRVTPEGGGGQGTGGAAGTTARRQWGHSESGGAGEIDVLKSKYPGYIDSLIEYPFLEKLYKEALRTNDFSKYDSSVATIDTKWKARTAPGLDPGEITPSPPVVSVKPSGGEWTGSDSSGSSALSPPSGGDFPVADPSGREKVAAEAPLPDWAIVINDWPGELERLRRTYPGMTDPFLYRQLADLYKTNVQDYATGLRGMERTFPTMRTPPVARKEWGDEILVLKSKYPNFIDSLIEYPFLEKLYKEALRTSDFSSYDAAMSTIDTKWKARPIVEEKAPSPPSGGDFPPVGSDKKPGAVAATGVMSAFFQVIDALDATGVVDPALWTKLTPAEQKNIKAFYPNLKLPEVAVVGPVGVGGEKLKPTWQEELGVLKVRWAGLMEEGEYNLLERLYKEGISSRDFTRYNDAVKSIEGGMAQRRANLTATGTIRNVEGTDTTDTTWDAEQARLEALYPGELAPGDIARMRDLFENNPAEYAIWLAGFIRVADQRKNRPPEGPPVFGAPGGPASPGDVGQPPSGGEWKPPVGVDTIGTVPATGPMASFFQAVDELEAAGEISRELWNKLTSEEQATLRTAPGFKLAYETTIPPGDLGVSPPEGAVAPPPEESVVPPEPGTREATALKELETRLTGSGYTTEETNSIIAGFQTGGYEGYFQALDRVDVARRNNPEALKAVRSALQDQINTLTQSMKFDADKYLTAQTAATDARYQDARERLARQFGIDPGGPKTGKAQQQFELLESSRIQELNKLQNDVTDKLLDFQQKTLANFTSTFQTLAGAELNMTQLTETVRQFNETLTLELKKYNLSEQEVTAGIAKINADILNSTRQTSAVIGQRWAEVLGFAGTESGTVSAAELGIAVSAIDKVLPFLPVTSARRSAIKTSFAAMMGREPTNDEINAISIGKSITVEGKPTLKARELASTVLQQDMERTSKYAAIAGQLGLDTLKFTQAQTESDRQWNLSIGDVAGTVGFDAAQAATFQTAKYVLDGEINTVFFDTTLTAAQRTTKITALIERAANTFAGGVLVDGKFVGGDATLKAAFLQASTLFDTQFGNKQNQIARALGIDADTWATSQRQIAVAEDRQLAVWGSLIAGADAIVSYGSTRIPKDLGILPIIRNDLLGLMSEFGFQEAFLTSVSAASVVDDMFKRATPAQMDELSRIFTVLDSTPGVGAKDKDGNSIDLIFSTEQLRQNLVSFIRGGNTTRGMYVSGTRRDWVTKLDANTRESLFGMLNVTTTAERQSGSLLGSLFNMMGNVVGTVGGTVAGIKLAAAI